MASVDGLAPSKVGLKGRAPSCFAFTDKKNRSPRLVARQRLLVFSEALIYLSYSRD